MRPDGKGRKWYDKKKYRLCSNGDEHRGALELVTWEGKDEDGDELGWGACFKEESDDLKRKFEEEYGSNEEKFFAYWPQGFRWTCCGVSGDTKYGCDHHGTGPKPCTCDFCRMGKPLTKRIYRDNQRSPHGVGLNLSQGPDPRSYNPAIGSICALGRGLVGLATDDGDGESSACTDEEPDVIPKPAATDAKPDLEPECDFDAVFRGNLRKAFR